MQFKFVVIGEVGVGKSTIVYTLQTGKFPTTTLGHTVGASFGIKKYEIDRTTIDVQLWDTAGQERYRSMIRLYYRDVTCFILIMSIETHPDELVEQYRYWMTEIMSHANSERFSICVLFNKIDIDPTFQIPAEIQTDNTNRLFKITAKDPQQVADIFQDIVSTLYYQEIQHRSDSHKDIIKIQDKTREIFNRCCQL